MNKGSVKMDELKKGWITAGEVHNHLESVLNCPILSEFHLIKGANPYESYVIMFIAIDDKYALASSDSDNYVDQVLAENCSDLEMKGSIWNKLLKYAYPQDAKALSQFILNQTPKTLVDKGLYGENLKLIVDNVKPRHSAEYKHMAMVVRPEIIIREMVTDPEDDDPGDFFIDYVANDPNAGIRWRACTIKRVYKNVVTKDTATIRKIYASL